jgi:branched-chain amino acid transport system ATP-binding protein
MLSLDRIHAGYGDTTVLRDVTVHIPSSSVVALVGPNGAGKTTMLRVASGLIQPRSGHVRYGAAELTGRPPHVFVAQGIHHIPEGRGIFRALSVRENLIAFSLPGREKEAAERAVAAFPRLGALMSRVAGTLSGGEQQMVALSRAYIRQPAVVLLDEVSMGLAPNLVDEIFRFLRLLSSEGSALGIVEQYVAKVLDIADYAYMFNRGSIVFAGEPEELCRTDVFMEYLGGSQAVA